MYMHSLSFMHVVSPFFVTFVACPRHSVAGHKVISATLGYAHTRLACSFSQDQEKKRKSSHFATLCALYMVSKIIASQAVAG